jgi:hypothetical protein
VAAATGERIVAFGRVGKPLEKPFFSPFVYSCQEAAVHRCNGI